MDNPPEESAGGGVFATVVGEETTTVVGEDVAPVTAVGAGVLPVYQVLAPKSVDVGTGMVKMDATVPDGISDAGT